MIEKGRHMKLEKEERICPVCSEGVEDEIHFLLNCKQYDSLREPLLHECSDLKRNFRYNSDVEKFISMMTTPVLMGNVSKFINSAFNERDTYLDASLALNDIIEKVCLVST